MLIWMVMDRRRWLQLEMGLVSNTWISLIPLYPYVHYESMFDGWAEGVVRQRKGLQRAFNPSLSPTATGGRNMHNTWWLLKLGFELALPNYIFTPLRRGLGNNRIPFHTFLSSVSSTTYSLYWHSKIIANQEKTINIELVDANVIILKQW